MDAVLLVIISPPPTAPIEAAYSASLYKNLYFTTIGDTIV